MSQRSRSRCADYAIYLAIRLIVVVLQLIPIELALQFGRLCGWVVSHFDRRHRQVAADNLRQAFPSLSGAEIDGLVRGTYCHACTMVVETLILMRLLRPGNVAEIVRDADIDKCRFVWDLLRSARPVIILTGHIGNWEVMGLATSLEGA